VVPDERVQRRELSRLAVALGRVTVARLAEDRAVVDRLRARLPDPRFELAAQQQRLDEFWSGLERAAQRGMLLRRRRLEALQRALAARGCRAVLADGRSALGPLRVRLRGAMQARLEREGARLEPIERRLEVALRRCLAEAHAELGERVATLDALSPLAVLGRGYAIALGRDGRALRAARDVSVGDDVDLRLAEGRLRARVTGREP
jgi:exodeoxyribonuclease VII large subunit